MPYDQRAIEVDPNFALGYRALAIDYQNLGEEGRANEYLTRAFQLREHASEMERLEIAAEYYMVVTGEMEKAAETYQQEIDAYPRDERLGARGNLGLLYAAQGQYEKAIAMTKEGMRLKLDGESYAVLAGLALALQRFDEARQAVHEAQAREADDQGLHSVLYVLAFLGGDSAAMAEQLQWFAGKPEYEDVGLGIASGTESYAGHLGKARELIKRAVDSAVRKDNKETGAGYLADSAVQEAAFGNAAQARQTAAEALKLAPASRGVETEAGLALAMTGETARAESLAQDLGKRFPLHTQTQLVWLPAIQAQLALDRRDSAASVTALQAATPIDLGRGDSCLYHVYLRGEAYLAGGQGGAAADEFQKIIDHSGIVQNCWTGALAHLGVARANARQSRSSQGADADLARSRALAAYKDFLALWKDADSDIPVLKQARAEYAKLR